MPVAIFPTGCKCGRRDSALMAQGPLWALRYLAVPDLRWG